MFECLEIHISMTDMPPRARAAPSEARGSPINVDQRLARNGCVVVELEAPKGAGRGILEFKDCILICAPLKPSSYVPSMPLERLGVAAAAMPTHTHASTCTCKACAASA